MNSNEIFKVIESIGATSSKIAKEQLIRNYSDYPEFVRVLKAAYDPLITYGIQAVPAKRVSGSMTFDAGTWAMLNRLAERTLTGNAAQSFVQRILNELTDESAALLQRIIKKDLRAGFSESTINKAIPGLIPEFPYMRCSLPKAVKLDQWPWDEGVISQEKADGMFVNINHERNGDVQMLTRKGTQLPLDQFAQLVLEIKWRLLINTQTHGEMLVEQDGKILPREIGNGILNSVIKGGKFEPGQRPILKVWDQIPLDVVKPKGEYQVGYYDRWEHLVEQLKQSEGSAIEVIETRFYGSLDGCYSHYLELLALGKEGTVFKHPDAIWRDGTSKQQVKLKLEADCELEVIGMEPGKGKNAATFGSLICRSSCDRLLVSVSGFSDKLRKEIRDKWDDWNRCIITVRGNAIMYPSNPDKPHSLFLPRFVERRLDKRVADSLERIQEQFDNAIKVAS